jgi:hypothetical protein
MKAQCKQKSFKFQPHFRKEVVSTFDGGTITSDAGSILLREVEARSGIIRQFSECFTDFRNPEKIEHKLKDLIAQRIFGLALGYEDLNDHDDLRLDPMLALLVGKLDPTGQDRIRDRDKGKALAGKSTLNRVELTLPDANTKSRYKKVVLQPKKVDQFFVDMFLQSHKRSPKQIILDLDATDDPLHGKQEGRFFHGFYNNYCYLPLYIFCGNDLLCARLRRSNIDVSEGSVEELDRIVRRIRHKWTEVKIIIRGDSGFCRESIMSWCEKNDIDYVLGIAKNSRLNQAIEEELEEAKKEYEATGKASRIFKDFNYRTRKSWGRSRRVVGKAEYLAKGANPRFVVTSIPIEILSSQALYENVYCGRGDMENRIKEQQLYLFADRTSCSQMRANQIRLWFSSVAYTLMQALRRLGLKGTKMEKAQCHTIRLKLLKIGARIRITTRRILISMASGYPYENTFALAYSNLQRAGPL